MKGDDVICVGEMQPPLKWFQPSEPETGTETRTQPPRIPFPTSKSVIAL